MPLHMSRRHFLKHALAAGAGIGTLTGCRDSVSPLLSVGICGPVRDHLDYAQSGYAYIEPTVQGFLVPEASEAEFQANLDLLRESNLSVPVANSFLPSTLKVVGPEANHEAVLGPRTVCRTSQGNGAAGGALWHNAVSGTAAPTGDELPQHGAGVHGCPA